MESFHDFLVVLTEKVLPPIFLVILGISGMILILGISFIRRMPGRRITGWFSMGSMVLVIFFPYVPEAVWLGKSSPFLHGFVIIAIAMLSSLLPFVAPILTLGVTTILLSRALTYVVATVQPILSWVLTLLFSLGSGIFFTILYWFSWRGETGEGLIVPASVGALAGSVVIFISFCVNVLEKQRGKKNRFKMKYKNRNK